MTGDLFVPKGRDLRVEYPELAEMEEFSDCSTKDMHFVWLYSCKSSPYSAMSKHDRLSVCLLEAYGNEFMSSDVARKLSQGEFPEYIKQACKVMETFDPGIRSRAKALLISTFDNVENMLSLSGDDKLAMSVSDKKAYLSMVSEASNTLPVLIAQIERGFGITNKKNTKKSQEKELAEDEGSLMDRVVSDSSR